MKEAEKLKEKQHEGVSEPDVTYWNLDDSTLFVH